MAGADLVSPAGRSTRRSQGATPVRDGSPPRRSTRASSIAAGSTPGARRSNRAASRRLETIQDTVTNAALPEIQTRQSYAYGSSKAPLLPEQLHAQETLSMNQVAARMDSAIQNAERNLVDQLAEVGGKEASERGLSKGPAEARANRAQAAKDPTEPVQKGTRNIASRGTSPASHATEVQKQRRTAAWASSLDSSHLEDISEESSSMPDSPETRRTDPSSFPSGIFDHSYNYERGMRAPRAEKALKTPTTLSRLGTGITTVCSTVHDLSAEVGKQAADWLWRLFSTFGKALSELPESTLISILLKSFLVVCMTGAFSMAICFVYTNHLCDPLSSSKVSQTLQSLCGSCVNTYSPPMNFTVGNGADMSQLNKALKHINNQISSLESRLGHRIDSSYMTIRSEMDTLRQQQDDLTLLLETHDSSKSHQPTDIIEVPSPLIPKVNFFSPGLGALVIAHLTSPTLSRPRNIAARVLLKMVGVDKYDVHGPLTALLPWQDVGDCWCASMTELGQDRIRIGVEIKEMIYPTELVVEHPPVGATLTPDTAPRDIEVWADFSHVSAKQWAETGIESMQRDGYGVHQPFGESWAKIASVIYDSSPDTHHVQAFTLDVNQAGSLRFAARNYVVRARTNHGAAYGCLYRLRLHGVPVKDTGELSIRNY